jgi:hypothetical protein
MPDGDRLPRYRSSWPVHVCRLGEEPTRAGETTAEQRLAMMWELVTQAWAMAGREIPAYDRRDAPGRVLSRSDADDE